MAKARRDKGSGSVYQRGDGLWVASITLPDGPGGKRRRKVVSHRTEAGVKAKLRDLRKELDRAGDLATSSPTTAAYLRSWIERKRRTSLKPTTAEDYEGKIERYIIPSIGRVRLDRLTTAHVEKVHDYITTAQTDGHGEVVRKALSSTTALGVHRVLAVALRDALRAGLVARNVATLVDAPRKALSTRGALTADQARKLLLAVADDLSIGARCAVALLAGLRQGEKLGITREALDLDRLDSEGNPAPTLTVSWQVQRLTWDHGCVPDGAKKPARGEVWPCGRKRAGSCPGRRLIVPPDQEVKQVHGGLWMTRPKTRTGWREVPIAEPLEAILRRYVEQVPAGEEGLIFHRGGEAGERWPIDPSDDSDAWHAALDRAGLPQVPLHSARHTTATLLRQIGVPADVRMQILGHADEQTTAGYTHLADAEAIDAMRQLGALVLPES